MTAPARIALLLCGLLAAAGALADTRDEITTALDYYAERWNEGDFEALNGYYDPAFVLVTRDGRLPLSARLADLESLASSGKDRGELDYSNVQVQALGDGYALAHGSARLQFADGSAIDSWFSTVYRKTPFGWKAILTHQ